jgi:hypothetical protein
MKGDEIEILLVEDNPRCAFGERIKDAKADILHVAEDGEAMAMLPGREIFRFRPSGPYPSGPEPAGKDGREVLRSQNR